MVAYTPPNAGGAPWLWRRHDSTAASCTKSCASASQQDCCRAKSNSPGACCASHCSQFESAGNSYFEPLFTRFHLSKRRRLPLLSKIIIIIVIVFSFLQTGEH